MDEDSFVSHALLAMKHICLACEHDEKGTTGNLMMPAIHAICDALEDELDSILDEEIELKGEE